MGELVSFVLLDNIKLLTNFTHYLFTYKFTDLTDLRIYELERLSFKHLDVIIRCINFN
jgi:hypothetical protein